MDLLVGKKRIENAFKSEDAEVQILQKKEDLHFKKENVYFVETGALKKVVENIESSLILAFYGPGDLTYGSGNLFAQSENTKDIVSFTALSHGTKVNELSSKAFKAMVLQSPHKASIYKTLGVDATLQQWLNEERLTMKLTRKSYQQIARVIHKMASLYGRELADKDGYVMNFPTAHADIGGFVGCSRQTVTQTMNELRNEGIIEFNRNRIYIKNMNTLKNVIHFDKK